MPGRRHATVLSDVPGRKGIGMAEASLRRKRKPAASVERWPRRHHVGDATGRFFRGRNLRHDDHLQPAGKTSRNGLLGPATGTGAANDDRRTDSPDHGSPLAVGGTDATIVLRDGRGRQRYRQVLRPMLHPRTGQRLEWQWVVDYYHASLRITVLAEALFGQTRAAESWARRMRKLLLKPNGPSRVLHAAAARRCGHGVIAHRRRDYNRAYEYLRQRTKHMQYCEYRRQHLPIGSGVTEAACKTVFTQRLKLSGMRWKHEGASRVLTLSVILLSGIWEDVYASATKSSGTPLIRTYQVSPTHQHAIAA